MLDGFPCFDFRKTCIDVLNGKLNDDSLFAALYELDENDDWRDESTWIKANPSIGETITYEYLRDQVRSAINQPSLEVGVRTKHMNQFVQSEEVWLSSPVVEAVMDEVNLEDFKDEDAFCGVDLAATSDLTCTTIMFPPNPYRAKWPDKFVFKTFEYIPEDALKTVNGSKYLEWQKHSSTFKIIPGNVTDYEVILNDQLELSRNHNITMTGYDQWNATQYTINAEKEGLVMAPYSQSLGNFNRPSKNLERLILSQKCIIDRDPCVKWCFNNVVLVYDSHDNIKPSKTTRQNKIDPVISIITALGTYLDDRGMDIEIV